MTEGALPAPETVAGLHLQAAAVMLAATVMQVAMVMLAATEATVAGMALARTPCWLPREWGPLGPELWYRWDLVNFAG